MFRLSSTIEEFFTGVSGLTLFAIDYTKALFSRPFETREFIKQCYRVGYTSILLIGITGFILGMVLTLQSRPVLAEFGAEAWLPQMVSASIVIEIGPVITALICAGKIGSSYGAEIGSMKVTEQLDAMEVSGTNPMKFVVVTRVLATTLMVPILVFYADAISFVGSYLGVNMYNNFSLSLFITHVFDAFSFADFIPATIKTFFFGFAIGIIGCYKGYTSQHGTEGVGKAANSAVINASLAIFILDLVAVQVTSLIVNIL
jgi:phospholipid/cholesterol/gamma-HCH transport system permease protein